MNVRKSLSVFAAGCAATAALVAVPAQADAAPRCPTTVIAATSKAATVSALRNTCSQAGVDRLFRAAQAGALPVGVYNGQARPIGGPNNGASSAIGGVWAGKHFYRGWLTNRVLGGEALPANVYYGRSAVDGKRVIRIDYARSGLHDEIRRLGNGVYLGYGFDGPRRIITFWVWR
ncbi:hypothetical protein [Gordonia sp. PDNC005]|uniref:hypothetical protein n=1 Tax=Gordonia sp. PDNC005 TaxID=2811424 RepID=UPI001F067ACB|nr:hypothetical protein [Gordonia sp. PDNC005]